ncbi:hypothetical protein P4B35_20490 [Pontiellaceae bacterium B12227]|nr:hypothetical protein [Pontiellaceae bacterium B12227]
MKTIITILILTVAQGCVTTEESHRATHDPVHAMTVQEQLKTDEDWEQWHKLQKHNRSAIFILE